MSRDLGDAWFVAYGLAYLSAVRASQGDLDAALDASREAADLAAAPGFGYPLALARMHALWQEEVRAPGAPGARAADRGGAARGAAARPPRAWRCHLAWVRLLHRVADPAVPDDALADELADGVRAAPRARRR